MVACLGVSEVGGGSDVAALRTTARRDGDEWVINGGKMWTTNGAQVGFGYEVTPIIAIDSVQRGNFITNQ